MMWDEIILMPNAYCLLNMDFEEKSFMGKHIMDARLWFLIFTMNINMPDIQKIHYYE